MGRCLQGCRPANDEARGTADEAQGAAGGQGREIALGPVNARRERKRTEGRPADSKHERRAPYRAKMIPSKILGIACCADGLLRAVCTAQAQRIEPADGDAAPEG